MIDSGRGARPDQAAWRSGSAGQPRPESIGREPGPTTFPMQVGAEARVAG